ncbi:hypothetical protein [Fluviicola taffensis]|uniref:hypothetical protein n=1 Tax=Fluviicola taffensis TaxID=191579 RepID=UPI00313772CA
MKRQENSIDNYLNSLEHFRKIEGSIANYIGIQDLRSGNVTIRNEKGWRENEKSIEYIWIVKIARSFVGWGGIFAIKFAESEFRGYSNKEELIHGIFISSENGAEQLYIENLIDMSQEKVSCFKLNLFDANKGVSLDGIAYDLRIIARNVDTFIQTNNPNTNDWKKWEAEIWEMGRQLAKNSNDLELIKLFQSNDN